LPVGDTLVYAGNKLTDSIAFILHTGSSISVTKHALSRCGEAVAERAHGDRVADTQVLSRWDESSANLVQVTTTRTSPITHTSR
jgi:hypothetical protein